MLTSQAHHLQWHHYKEILLVSAVAVAGFFDFMIFWYHSDMISYVFLGQDRDQESYFFYNAILFFIGYLACPLGGFLIGHYGDKNGRRSAVLLSLSGTFLFTLIIAFLPNYAQIGSLATLLFILARLGQGIAFGGQLPTLWVLVCEKIPMHSIGMACGVITCGTLIANTVLFMAINLIEMYLSFQEILAWGWRICFGIGAFFSLVVLLLSRNLGESPVYQKHKKSIDTAPKLPIAKRFQGFIATILLSWTFTSITTVILFLSQDLLSVVFLVNPNILQLSLFVCFCFIPIGSLLFGFLTDIINAAQVLFIGVVLFLLSLLFMFYDLSLGGAYVFISFALVGLFAGVIGALPSMMVRLCPVRHRITTTAFGYGLVYATTGIFTPFVLGYLTYYIDFAPILYLSFVCTITLFLSFYLYYRPRTPESIDGFE